MAMCYKITLFLNLHVHAAEPPSGGCRPPDTALNYISCDSVEYVATYSETVSFLGGLFPDVDMKYNAQKYLQNLPELHRIGSSICL